MDELEKSAHKVFKLKYHFVFCVKYRKDMFLNQDYCETFKYTCKQMEARYSIMLKSLAKYSPSQLFRIVKSVTAIRMFKTYPEIKEELWGGEFWSDGGYVGTVGEGVNADIIREYIKRQGRKGEQLKLFDFV